MVSKRVDLPGINAEHGDAEKREGEGLWNGEVHVVPLRCVVASPVGGPFARADECGTAEEEGSLAWENGKKTLVGSVEDLMTVKL